METHWSPRSPICTRSRHDTTRFQNRLNAHRQYRSPVPLNKKTPGPTRPGTPLNHLEERRCEGTFVGQKGSENSLQQSAPFHITGATFVSDTVPSDSQTWALL